MMKTRLVQFFLSVALLRRVGAWKHVTEARFRQALRNDYTLVAFVDPGQQASQALEREWTSIQETERDNNVVSVDCDAKMKICDEYDIVSFPAIRLFHDDGRVDRYRGARTASSIVPFLRRALRPTISHLDDKNITSFLSIDDVVFVAHISEGDTVVEERFIRLADQLKDRFSFATGPARPQSIISCFNTQDDIQQTTTDLTTVESLEAFIKLCSAPLIIPLTRRNELEYLNTGKSLVHYFTPTESDRQAYLKEIRPLARKYQEYLLFTTVDTNEYPDMRATLGLQAGSSKALSVQNPGNGDVFPYAGKADITLPVVENFLTEIIQGNVKPWSRSTENNAGTSHGAKHDEL